MREYGASDEAISFASVHPEHAVLTTFEERGVVDIGCVFFPGSNNRGRQLAFVNGTPSVILVSDSDVAERLELALQARSDYTDLISPYPDSLLDISMAVLVEDLTVTPKDQTFLMAAPVSRSCITCEWLATVVFSVIFDQDGGLQEVVLNEIKPPLDTRLGNARYTSCIAEPSNYSP